MISEKRVKDKIESLQKKYDQLYFKGRVKEAKEIYLIIKVLESLLEEEEVEKSTEHAWSL